MMQYYVVSIRKCYNILNLIIISVIVKIWFEDIADVPNEMHSLNKRTSLLVENPTAQLNGNKNMMYKGLGWRHLFGSDRMQMVTSSCCGRGFGTSIQCWCNSVTR